MDTKQTFQFGDYSKIFDGAAAPAQQAPAAPQVFVLPVQQQPQAQQPAASQQQMVVPVSLLEEYQRKQAEAAAKRDEEMRRAAALMAPPPAQVAQQPSEDGAKMKDRMANMERMLMEEQAARKAAELRELRARIIAEYRSAGLDMSFDALVVGNNEIELRASAANALSIQAQAEARMAQRLMQQGVPAVQQPMQAQPMPQMVQQQAVPVGYVTQPPMISAPSMISAPAPVQANPLANPNQLAYLTSHEAMTNGDYARYRAQLMSGMMQGAQPASVTQYAATPAPPQFQPMTPQPAQAFSAPQSRFVPGNMPPPMAQPRFQDPAQQAQAALNRFHQMTPDQQMALGNSLLA